MPDTRLIHDSAWAGSIHVLEIFQSVLDPEQQRDKFAQVYDALHELLETHDLLAERQRRRLTPSQN